jgi:phosphoglycerate dehydrogenase-like enzyme
VGAGVIGKRTAAICKAFGCTVIAYSEEVLKRSDIVFENLYSWLDGKQINCI